MNRNVCMEQENGKGLRNFTILRKSPTDKLYVNITLFTHVSALKDSSAGSAGIFCDQGQQNTWPDVHIRLTL